MRWSRLPAAACAVACLLACLAIVGATAATSTSTSTTTTSASCAYEGGRVVLRMNVIDHSATAWGKLEDSIMDNGWQKFQVASNPNADPVQQVYCAGYVEGVLTAEAIYHAYQSTVLDQFSDGQAPEKLLDFFQTQWQYAQSLVTASPSDAYYAMLGRVLEHYEGLADGYNAMMGGVHPLTLWQLQIVNAEADLGNIMAHLFPSRQYSPSWPRQQIADYMDFHAHCSVLVSLLPAHRSLLAGHSTWASFATMLRTYKKYSVPALGMNVVLSGYPGGGAFSSDDFYITQPANLFVTETTNNIYNNSLYQLITTQSLLCWQRTILANALATSGPEWHTIFQRHLSGTYTNQWIVIDYKLFKAGMASLAANTLTIGEEMPGLYTWADQSEFLEKNGHWPSYNVPFYPQVYQYSGYAEAAKTMGDMVSYTKCPRARIFARDWQKVKDMDSLNTLLRYNDFQHDPLSEDHPEWAIMSRYDLRKGTASTASPRPFGGIDTKTTNDQWMPAMRAAANCGPTHDTQPVFSWSQFEQLTNQTWPHYGQPDTFNFGFVDMQWEQL